MDIYLALIKKLSLWATLLLKSRACSFTYSEHLCVQCIILATLVKKGHFIFSAQKNVDIWAFFSITDLRRSKKTMKTCKNKKMSEQLGICISISHSLKSPKLTLHSSILFFNFIKWAHFCMACKIYLGLSKIIFFSTKYHKSVVVRKIMNEY